jgi:hypothetical protein
MAVGFEIYARTNRGLLLGPDLDIELEMYRREYGPEETMWFAALKDAYMAVHGLVMLDGAADAGDRKRKKLQLIREDRAWFKSNRRDTGSYLWICEMLDIHPDTILAQLESRGLLSGGIVLRDGRSRTVDSIVEITR